MRTLPPILLALGLLTVTTSVATARGGVCPGIGINAGAYLPTNSDASDILGGIWFSFGATYDVATTDVAVHRVGLGWVGAPGKDVTGTVTSSSNTTHEWDHTFVPLTYSYVVTPTGKGNGLYYGAGGGVYFSSLEVKATAAAGSATASEDNTWFGLHGLAGYALSERFAAELRYTHIFDDVDDFDFNGISLSLRAAF